jgi:hypothetical protein
LNQSQPANLAVDLARRVSDASTLQCAGRPATSHVRLAQQPQDGDTLRVEAHPGEQEGVLVPGLTCTYRFTTTGTVPDDTVPVVIGASVTETASALAQAINGQQSGVLRAAVDGSTVDCTHRTPGAALGLTAAAGTPADPPPSARLVVQNNQEQLPQGPYHLYVLRRTVTAEDVSRGTLRVDTGLTTLLSGFARLYTSASDQTPDPFNGQATITGGVLTLGQGTGNGTWSSGNVVELLLFGVL